MSDSCEFEFADVLWFAAIKPHGCRINASFKAEATRTKALFELPLTLHAQVGSDNPFLASCYLTTFVQHTIIPMLVQEEHPRLQFHNNLLFDGRTLVGQVVGIEDCLAAFTTRGWGR